MQILPRSDTFYAGRKKFEILHTWHLSSVLLTTPIFIAISTLAAFPPEPAAKPHPNANKAALGGLLGDHPSQQLEEG